MSENKCPHCGEDMVWSGDMLTGGLACKRNHYADAGYDVEGVTPEQQSIAQRAMQNFLSQPGVVEKVNENIAKSNEILKKIEDNFVGTIPDDEADPPVCTDYVNDRLNLHILDRYGISLAAARAALITTKGFSGKVMFEAMAMTEFSGIASTFALRDDFGSTVYSGTITNAFGGGDMVMDNLHLRAGTILCVQVTVNIKE